MTEDLPPPYVDDRLVQPETREERLHGRRLQALPANPEHGDEHTELDYLARGDLAPGYVASTDLLTRAGEGSDFATDTCIRRAGIDPRTGSRYLEEVAFEVVNAQSLANMTERARQLTSCGVRRVFAIFVKTQQVGEWSSSQDRFITLDLDGVIEDRTFVRPLPVRALFDGAEADDSVARALKAKGNPVITEVRAEGLAEGQAEGRAEGRVEGRVEGRAEARAEGLAEGRAEAIELLCQLLDIPIGPEQRARMDELDADALLALLTQLQTQRRWLSA